MSFPETQPRYATPIDRASIFPQLSSGVCARTVAAKSCHERCEFLRLRLPSLLAIFARLERGSDERAVSAGTA